MKVEHPMNSQLAGVSRTPGCGVEEAGGLWCVHICALDFTYDCCVVNNR